MKTAKKIISMILLAVMCVSFMGIAAYADDIIILNDDDNALIINDDAAPAEKKEAKGGEIILDDAELEGGEKPMILKTGVEYAATVNGVKVETFDDAFNKAKSGDTIKVVASDDPISGCTASVTKNLTLDLNGQEVAGTLTVAAGATLTITNGFFNGVIENNGTLYIQSGDAAVRIKTLNNSGVAYVSDDLCKIDGINGTVPTKKSAPVTPEVDPKVSGKETVICRVPGASAVSYTVEPKDALTAVTVEIQGSKVTLTEGTHYEYDKSTGIVKINPSTLSPCDVFTVNFEFGTKKVTDQFKIYVMPADTINVKSYEQGSGDTVYLSIASDSPVGYSYSVKGSTKSLGDLLESDYSFSSGKLTLTKKFLDNLDAGTYSINYKFSDGVAVPFNSALEVEIDSGSLTVVEKVNKAWESGDGNKFFRLSIQTAIPGYVEVDGLKLDVEEWFNKGDYEIYLKTKFMEDLKPGTHTITVCTTDKHGNLTAYGSTTFQVAATLRPKNTDKHVTGSSYGLSFVCSDEIARVFVGGKELDNDWYEYDVFTLSKDGKTVTLTPKFMNNKLTAGSKYTLSVETVNGDEPECAFYVLTTAQASSSPKTGDSANFGLWAAAMAVTATAAVVLLPKLKKDEEA